MLARRITGDSVHMSPAMFSHKAIGLSHLNDRNNGSAVKIKDFLHQNGIADSLIGSHRKRQHSRSFNCHKAPDVGWVHHLEERQSLSPVKKLRIMPHDVQSDSTDMHTPVPEQSASQKQEETERVKQENRRLREAIAKISEHLSGLR